MNYATTLDLDGITTPVVVSYYYDEPVDVSATLTRHYTEPRNRITHVVARGRTFDCTDSADLVALSVALDCDAVELLSELEAEVGRRNARHSFLRASALDGQRGQAHTQRS
jgi:hypothetical protein